MDWGESVGGVGVSQQSRSAITNRIWLDSSKVEQYPARTCCWLWLDFIWLCVMRIRSIQWSDVCQMLSPQQAKEALILLQPKGIQGAELSFSKECFSKEFGKVWKKSLVKGWNKFGNRSELRRKMFLRPRYVRRFPSFVSARTFADMTTWPSMTMTTLKKQVGPSADPIVWWACLLKPSAGPGPPAPAVANTTRHANGKRPSRRINHRRCDGSGDGQAIQWASLFQWQRWWSGRFQSESSDVSDMPLVCPQICVAAVSQKLLPYNIIVFKTF